MNLEIKSIKYILITIILIAFATGLYLGEFHKLPFARNPNDFGAMASLIGGICGLIAVGLSSYALVLTNKTNNRQNEQFEIQSFESTFFNLIAIFNQRIDSLKLHGNTGNAVFEFILKDIIFKTNEYFPVDGNNYGIYSTIIHKLVGKTYKKEFDSLISPLHNILEFIEKSDVSVNLKDRFKSIHRSLLTLDQRELLSRISVVHKSVKEIVDQLKI